MPVLLVPESLMATTLKAVYNARNDLQGTLECRFRVDFFCGNVKRRKEKLQVSLCCITTTVHALACPSYFVTLFPKR